MTPRRLAAALLAALLSAACVSGQAALERARRALAQPDLALARIALLELFDEVTPDRAGAVAASLAAFREAGAIDTWLEAGERWSRSHPEDPLVAFYRGVAWQDLKHLARAEEALAQALEKAPDNPGVREVWAWNAVRRFDARAALERSEGATFPGADELRASQRARLEAQPKGVLFGLGVLGLLLVAVAVGALVRMGR
jgi:tetratricopeptide (TPR) repeat protein